MPKLKYSEELKLQVVQYVQDGHSMNEAAERFCISKRTVQKWVYAYEHHGANGILIKQHCHNKYTGDFKIHVVEYMLAHGLSATQTAAHFNIPAFQSVLRWNKIYEQEGPGALLEERRGRSSSRSATMKKRKASIPKETSKETLEEEVIRLRMENEYLKKLNALIQKREKSAKKTK